MFFVAALVASLLAAVPAATGLAAKARDPVVTVEFAGSGYSRTVAVRLATSPPVAPSGGRP
jgi:hypothetical protein